MVSAWLVVAAAGCSDDGLNVQGQNSSSTGNSGGDSSGNATAPVTTADEHGGTASADGGTTAQGTQGNVDTSAGSSTSEIPTGTTVDATIGATEGSSSGGPGTTEGSSSTGEVCEPITDDPSFIGGECINDVDCPDGYTCQPFAGIVFQLSCQILCMEDCECPLGYTCLEIADKSGATWHQCG